MLTCGTLISQTPVVEPITDPESPPPQALTYQAQALDNKGEPIKKFEEEIEYFIKIRGSGDDLYTGKLEKGEDIKVLIPSIDSVCFCIKGFPININGKMHYHPDDIPQNRERDGKIKVEYE